MTRRWSFLALWASILAPAFALAQGPPARLPGSGSKPFVQAPNVAPQPPAPSPNPGDRMVFRSGEALPEPTTPDEPENAPAAMPLPPGPIDPFLLTKKAGPFMVLAHTFRGPNALPQAQALAMELRSQFKLPAYIFFLKLKPGNSNIQGIPPTAPRYVNDPKVTAPESLRLVDEAAVLVGNCKTIEEADTLRDQIKKLKPATLGEKRSMFPWRDGKGLSRALVTTNPLIPAQDLYPGRPQQGHPAGQGQENFPQIANGAVVDPEILRSNFVPRTDPLVVQMNQGPHSIYKCPGRFTLVVAEISGRSTIDQNNSIFRNEGTLSESPLKTAAEDSEHLADLLAKHPTVKSLGIEPYVYHDLTSSRVTLGSFDSPDDPRIEQIRRAASTIQVETKRSGKTRYSVFLAPAQTVAEVPRP